MNSSYKIATGHLLLLFLSMCFHALYGFNGKGVIETADPIMGDYEGSYSLEDGTGAPLVTQVIALGKDTYRANMLNRFDQTEVPTVKLNGQKTGTAIHFQGQIEEGEYYGVEFEGDIESNKFTGSINYEGNNVGIFELTKTVRSSPSLGAEAPEGAVILFNGTNFEEWEQVPRFRKGLSHLLSKFQKKQVKWKLVEDAMEVKPGAGSIITKREFTDFRLHIEFRTPFMPEARGQDRGNSGVYLQGRYEVQVLDSYGLKGLDNECGGIYKVAAPLINMCSPPLQWQTYDITFHAPRFDSDGNKNKNASLTVLHNGTQIHQNIEIPNPTGSAKDQDIKQPGGIYLQDHGNPVQYRNIWLIELP